jgi:hypothetical protein
MLTMFGVVLVNCKQVRVRSHEKVLSIITFFKNGITVLNSKALVSQGCGENTNLCFHGVDF